MAFENLQPHRPAIIEWRKEGLTLGQVAERLQRKHSIATTPGTLSRFLRDGEGRAQLAPDVRSAVDLLTLLSEIHGEVRGRGDEQRMAIEHLAGELRIMREVMEETGARPPYPGPQGSRWGFWPGFLSGVVVCAILGALGYTQLVGAT